jgi:signal transduction histidine kinase
LNGSSKTPVFEATRLRQALAASEARLRSTLSDLEAARRQAAETRAASDRRLAILIHELRGPLAPMLILAQNLEDDPSLPPEHREAAATAATSSWRPGSSATSTT